MLKSLLATFRVPHLRAQLQLSRDVQSFYRLHFLQAAVESGLLAALKSPASRAEIGQSLAAKRPELLDSLLELGLAFGELSLEGGRYRLRGQLVRALAAPDGDPLAAMVQECVTYHGSAFRYLPARLGGAPLGDYLATLGGLIARSSRALEPFVTPFVRMTVEASGPVKLLEVGCGSGIYLRRAAQANAEVTGVGIDLQEEAVEQARANLATWGMSDRFTILQADVRRLTDETAGPFDLITLYNNVYYFPVAERPLLLRDLQSRLAPGGRLAIVTVMQESNVVAAAFDLILQSTVGCAPLPRLAELKGQLKESGFLQVRTTKLAPGIPFYGLLASG